MKAHQHGKRESRTSCPATGSVADSIKGKSLGASGLAVLLVALALIPLLLGGCSSTTVDPETGAKEIKAKDAAKDVDEPEGALLSKAKEMYEIRMFSSARQSFQSIKEGYPLGAYANFAEIKIADAYFFNSEYNEAAKAYEDFLKNYPASPDLPYVELQAGRAHLLSARGSGRDRQPLERALVLLDSVVEKYPGTPFAREAAKERVPVIEQLSAYDLRIIEFYRQRENAAAVAIREKQFAERWGGRLPPPAVEPSSPPSITTSDE